MGTHTTEGAARRTAPHRSAATRSSDSSDSSAYGLGKPVSARRTRRAVRRTPRLHFRRDSERVLAEREQRANQRHNWPLLGSSAATSRLMAGALADEALADRVAVEHLDAVLDARLMAREAQLAAEWEAMRERLAERRVQAESMGREGPRVPPPWPHVEPHRVASLLAGSTLQLARKAHRCATASGAPRCPNETAGCQQRRAKAHCPMQLVADRLDDIEQLYGGALAVRVLDLVRRELAPWLSKWTDWHRVARSRQGCGRAYGRGG